MNEEAVKNIIYVILTFFASSAGTFYFQKDRYTPIVEEKVKLEYEISDYRNTVRSLNQEIQNIDSKFRTLESEYQILNEKYSKLISSENAMYEINSFDLDKLHSTTLKTKDYLKFKLTKESIYINILRITDRGPIIKISGIKYFLTENGIHSPNDGENSFLLCEDSQFKIKYSSESINKGNAYITKGIIENIIMNVDSFDVDNQIVNIQYQRTLWDQQ